MAPLLLLVVVVVNAAFSEAAGVSAAASGRAREAAIPVFATGSEGAARRARDEIAFTVQTAWPSKPFVLSSMAPLPDGRHVAVADRVNHTILKIELPLSATSAVSVLAGKNGTNGFHDGPGEEALFDTPTHLAADCQGNLFVVDRNSYLRVISPQGDVTTIRSSSSNVSHLAPPQPPFMHLDSKPHHADPAKLGSGVSGMWYNASSGVLYVVDTGRQRIAAFAPAPAPAAAAAGVTGNAASYVAVTMEAAGGVGAASSGVSFGGVAGIPGCLCNAKNSSGGGGGHDAPPSSPWHVTWRDTEVAGGAFAAGVLCAHGKAVFTAAAAGTSHLGSALSLVIHRIASTALAVLLLLFSLPSRFMQQPQSTESSAASPEAPAAAEENEESGLLISFSDEEEDDDVGDGQAEDSPSIASRYSHPPRAPAASDLPVSFGTLQPQSSAELPATISAAAAGDFPGANGGSIESPPRAMTGIKFDHAVASGDAASAAGSTGGAALGSQGNNTASLPFAADQAPPAVAGAAPADAFGKLVNEQVVHTWVREKRQ
ncbi:unnamed protein product [Closterium sp. Yama58-4]|nr:unnamed protein product [Closterium sp. Yama58-4]